MSQEECRHHQCNHGARIQETRRMGGVREIHQHAYGDHAPNV